MSAVGGSIESISLDGRNFPVPTDAEFNRGLGGYENDVESNGDGGGRIIKTRVSWMLDSGAIEIDDEKGDAEFVQDLADGNGFFTVVISYVSGISYTGQGQLTDTLQHASKATTMGISLKGKGKLTPV